MGYWISERWAAGGLQAGGVLRDGRVIGIVAGLVG